MGTEDLSRRLSAIMSMDVEGYSRLMRDDEQATVRTLTAYRTAVTHMVQQYRGRVVDSPGDNLLAEFGSVVDAVNCAVEIQRELAERNAELAENRRMHFRIGINLGDVLEEGSRIYGDGVNIAARMESLAEAGGICISSTVYNAVESKIGLEYEFLGEHEVKNINKPIRAYRVLSFPGAAAHRVVKAKRAVGKTWRNTVIATATVLLVVAVGAAWYFYLRAPSVEPASVEKMAFPLPDKPSIAVLPFVNMSDDPKQDILGDGISEEIINALSKLDQVFVVARNSSFTYKKKAVKVQQVAEDLGVRYVVEGSVRKEGDRVRVTAQLIDAVRGHHLFSERYDRQLGGIFALQDEIAIKVLTEVRVKLADGDIARIQARGVSNVDAFFKLLEAYRLMQGMNREDISNGRRLVQEALLIDPESSRGYHLLAASYLLDYWVGPPQSRVESNAKGIELAQKSLAMDPDNGAAHALLGMLFINKGEYDKAVAEGERGASLDPNSVTPMLIYGSILMHACRFEEAAHFLEKALRLSPVNPPSQVLSNLGVSYRMLGRYEESVDILRRLLKEHPNHFLGHLNLAGSYGEMGRLDDANSEAEQVLRLNPQFSVEVFRKAMRYRNPADFDRVISAYRKAGLP